MNVKTKNQNVSVSDLGLVSLLATLNFQIVEMQRNDNSKRINFVFRKEVRIEEIIADFWADKKILVPIQTLFTTQRNLKNRIFANQ